MLTIFVLSWGGMSSGAVRIFASEQIPFLQLLQQQRQKKSNPTHSSSPEKQQPIRLFNSSHFCMYVGLLERRRTIFA
jgi:hypothetical protein